MTNNNKDQNLDKQRNDVLGAMRDVGRQIAVLAPDPNKPGYKGPVSVSENRSAKAGDDRDAMLGSMLFECFIGAALGEVFCDALNVPSQVRELDWGNAIDIYDEYAQDRHGVEHNFTLGQKNSIGGAFNSISSRLHKAMEKAFQDDMPQRQKLEQQYARLDRQLNVMAPAM